MKTHDFNKKFDIKKDIYRYLDISRARSPGQLHKEAKRLGMPRQSIIKVWVAERFEKVS